ncbi:MAG: hypothetical protein ABF242_03150 [Flavobacteriales bacterium]
MKVIVSSLFLLCFSACLSQVSVLEKKNDCEILSLSAANNLADKIRSKRLDSADEVINEWTNICSVSECTQRIIILNNILQKRETITEIREYFDNKFHIVLKYRINDAKKLNHGYIYNDSKSYFGFIPLRHKIDSVVQEEARKLLLKADLTLDERLICTLFMGETDKFEKDIRRNKYKDSYIKQDLVKKIRTRTNSWIATTFYTGIHSPISSPSVFGASPMFGFSFSSPLRNKFMAEVAMKFRINTNDQSFDYYANEDTNSVNSEATFFVGALFSYKIYESEKLMLFPKVGIGLEAVQTKIPDEQENSDNNSYHSIETLHLSIGFSAMTPVFNRNYLGLGINYHYSPYNSDDNLLTEINPSQISAELFFRF